MSTVYNQLGSPDNTPKNTFLAGPANGRGPRSYRKITVYDLAALFPNLQIVDDNGNTYFDTSSSGGGSGTITEVDAGTGLVGGGSSGAVTLSLDAPVSVANGGTGTASPGLIGGADISVTGTWPDQTISFTGSVDSIDFSQTFLLMGG